MKSAPTTFTGSNTTTIVFGLLAALLVFAVLTGWQLPLVAGARQAVIAVSALAILKLVLSMLHRLLNY